MEGKVLYFSAFLACISYCAAAICSHPGEYIAEIEGLSFPVVCALESNGHIAISLELNDQFDRGIIINTYQGNAITKCTDISKFFDYVPDDIFIGADFDYLVNNQLFTIELSYRHPTSHYVYSDAELDAILMVTSGLSLDTRMVAVVGDADNGDIPTTATGHEVYIRTGNTSFELTPGTSGNCDDGDPAAYYLWSTNPKASQKMNVVDFPDLLPGLPAELAIPNQLVAAVYTGGGIAWGYERRNILLPLQEQQAYSAPDLFERYECILESNMDTQTGGNSYTFLASDCSLTELEYANLLTLVEEERCVASLLWTLANGSDEDWKLIGLTVTWWLAGGGSGVALKAQYLCW